MTGLTSSPIPPLAGQPAKAGLASSRQPVPAHIPKTDFSAVFDAESTAQQQPETADTVDSDDPEAMVHPDDSERRGQEGPKIAQRIPEGEIRTERRKPTSAGTGLESAPTGKRHLAYPITSDRPENGQVDPAQAIDRTDVQKRIGKTDTATAAPPESPTSPLVPERADLRQRDPASAPVFGQTMPERSDGIAQQKRPVSPLSSEKVRALSEPAPRPILSRSAAAREYSDKDMAPTSTRPRNDRAAATGIEPHVLPKESPTSPNPIEPTRKPRGTPSADQQAIEPALVPSDQQVDSLPLVPREAPALSSAKKADNAREFSPVADRDSTRAKTGLAPQFRAPRQTLSQAFPTGETEQRAVAGQVTPQETGMAAPRHLPTDAISSRQPVATTAQAGGFKGQNTAEPRRVGHYPELSSGHSSPIRETVSADRPIQASAPAPAPATSAAALPTATAAAAALPTAATRVQVSGAPGPKSGDATNPPAPPVDMHAPSRTDRPVAYLSVPPAPATPTVAQASPERGQAAPAPGLVAMPSGDQAVPMRPPSDSQPPATTPDTGQVPDASTERPTRGLTAHNPQLPPEGDKSTATGPISPQRAGAARHGTLDASAGAGQAQSNVWETSRPLVFGNMVKAGFTVDAGALPEPGIELPPEIPIGLSGTGAPSTTASALPAETARQIGGQMATAVANQTGADSVEIALDPEELGRVQMNLKTRGDVLTLTIIAERPETVDLMRRHIDQLSSEFRQMGYVDVTFSFGGSHTGAHGDPHQGSGEAGPSSETAETDHPDTPEDRPRIAASGLDMRL